ncbi:MAG: hypothetical protein ACRC62_01340 [Microcoleus sp.]
MKKQLISIAILSLLSIAPDAIAAKPKDQPYGGNPCPIVGPGYPICPPPVPPKTRIQEDARIHVPPHPPGCRNVNDDVKECPDRPQRKPKPPVGYFALKTPPTQIPDSPRRIKISEGDRTPPPGRRGSPKGTIGGGTRIAGLPKAASLEKGAKNDRAYRGSGRVDAKKA